nr:RNA-directed DNA polymerase, eukaryota [Tanacetum cinerariifolium]
MSDHNFHNPYEDQTQKISKSAFVTNFPEDSTARDLLKVCSDYGTVVDVFIPFKRSKLELIQATSSFENDERIVWISIEGLPIKAWTPNTFHDQDDLSFDGESQEGDVANKDDNNESDVDRVSKLSFMHENDTAHKDVNSCKKGEVGSHSEDPFNIYESISLHTIKDIWGNQMFDHVVGSSVGCSEGILCVWNPNMFVKEQVSICDYFVALMGTWAPTPSKLHIIFVYATQELNERRDLWDYLRTFIDRWKQIMIMVILYFGFSILGLLWRVSILLWKLPGRKSNDEILIKRITLLNDLQELDNRNVIEISQKDKIRWSIEGEENSKYFHGLPYLISDVQSAFIANHQILDGPFILNELLSWCKFKKLHGMIFKVDFKKDFDYVNWDYLDKTLKAFGFGSKWRNWISSCLDNAMGSVLVNGSPTLEFQFHKGSKEGDVVFIGEWYNNNIQTLLSVLRRFYLALGLKINLYKSKLIGIGVSSNVVAVAASLIGCSILTAPFNYLGLKVGSNMSRITSWDDVISKVSSRLSKWKLKLFSIGGRLSLLKSVLTSIPLYHMSIFKVPIGVLNHLESIRQNLFYGVDDSDRKLAWIGWNMVLTTKKNGGLGVSSFFAHNRALVFKWVWRFLTDGSSLWTHFINAIFAEVPTRWLRVIPIKVNVHAWRVCLDKLPTRANLSLRGLDIPSIACPLCNSTVESPSHIFSLVPCLAKFGEIF